MMKQHKRYFLTALLAILLVCFILPSSALAASRESNDNHTDTTDYCLRAHDVTIGLSEFSSKTRSELESDIVSASAFVFKIRTVESFGELLTPIYSGYSVDFSALTEAASSSGYLITVTLPAITMSTASEVHFRVFVVDDLPHPRNVTYLFVSGTTGYTLPEGVTAQLPASESILSGETVTPGASFSSVRDGAGIWTFSAWSPDSVMLSDSDVIFTGTWVWTALPVYTVTYEFISTSSGRALPDGVLSMLPPPASGVDGDTFTPQDSFRAYHMADGAWRFQGWNLTSQTIAGDNLAFTGEWRWHKNSVAAPAQAATATLTLTPAITNTPAPTLPSASPEQQIPIQVLEQTPSDPPTPMTNDPIGGAAKMMIASVLTALVTTQAFAVASDLKVLKWYNVKKAARRTGA